MNFQKDGKLMLNQIDPFLKKFEGRYEKMGAGGIKEVVLKESVPLPQFVKKSENKKNPFVERKKDEKMYSRMMNQYNILTTGDYKRIAYNNEINNNNLIENHRGEIRNNYNNYDDFNNYTKDYTNNYTNNYNDYKINNNNNINNRKNNNNSNSNSNSNSNITNNNIINTSKNKNKNEIQNKGKPSNKNNLIYNNNNNKSRNNNNESNINNLNGFINNNNKNYAPVQLNHSNSYPPYQLIDNDITNNYSELNKENPLKNERFYKPYSLKEYKNIMENYKNDRFGGLGKNMNKDWKEREKMMKKVKKFENSVVKNFNEKINSNNYKRIQSPQKMQLMKIGNQIINSKRYIAQKYGKGVKLNKVRDKKKNDILEMNYMNKIKGLEEYMKRREYERRIKDEDIIHMYDNVVHDKRDYYQNKLLALKSSLI